MQQLKTEIALYAVKRRNIGADTLKDYTNMLLDILKEKLLPDFAKTTKNMKTSMKMAVMENMILGKQESVFLCLKNKSCYTCYEKKIYNYN